MPAELDPLAVTLATVAACVFAAANNLQRGAASVVPLEVGGPIRLVLHLLRARRWLLGSLLALIALGLHAAALGRGGVILVQAILAAGLVVALVIEAATEHRWIRGVELTGSIVLVAGVTVLLGWGRPGGGRPVDVRAQVITGIALLMLIGIGMAASRAHHRVHASAVVMGAVAGACFALDAVYLKGVANNLDGRDAVAVVTNLIGFLAASLLGNLIVQRAYQRAPLRLVLPAVTVADPLGAFIVGKLLLDERLQGGDGATLAVVLGSLGMVIGIVLTTWSGTTQSQTGRSAGIDDQVGLPEPRS